jgi:hypothetical protein
MVRQTLIIALYCCHLIPAQAQDPERWYGKYNG